MRMFFFIFILICLLNFPLISVDCKEREKEMEVSLGVKAEDTTVNLAVASRLFKSYLSKHKEMIRFCIYYFLSS